jgi:protein-disulfide isomerase
MVQENARREAHKRRNATHRGPRVRFRLCGEIYFENEATAWASSSLMSKTVYSLVI